MVQGWVTMLVLAFGIIVAVIGVLAYLRMFRKDRLSAASRSGADVSPPKGINSAAETDDRTNLETVTEHAATKD